ncbi:uncharacterized protein LOC134284776 [Aedes albopictus]|uniref:Uncharacterized protein n=1 Tax=Aedes albopictus TaxID=7160 RepID=A0ABM1YMI7_AEDAL
MIEVKSSQTAKFLKSKVLEVLKRYDLSLDQVLSITSDNGANMIAAGKLLQRLYTQTALSDMFTDDELTDDFGGKEGELLEAMATDLSKQFNIVRCSVHTLQLALNDVVSNTDCNIKKITDFSKQMKKIKYKYFFDANEASYPPLWCPTRWSGKYKLINSFIKQEVVFKKMGEEFPELGNLFFITTIPITYTSLHSTILALSEEDWQFCHDFESAFKPLHVMTKKLQSNNQVFPDFYMEWILAIRDLRIMQNNPFFNPLIEALNVRLASLKNNMLFKVSLFVDPRFTYLNSTFFTPDEKEEIQV